MWVIVGIIGMFLGTWGVTRGYLVHASRAGWLDRPNLRSSHTKATPRGGGVGFVLMGIIWFLLMRGVYQLPLKYLWIILPPWLGLAVLGFVDDRISLPAKVRFLVQFILIATSVFALGGLPDIMMPGLNLHLGWFSGAHELAFISWGITAAVIAFLTFNWAPATLFMGDVGSCPLGFIIFAMTIISVKYVGITPIVWFILYGVFLFDASVTLLRRILNGEKWYQAHKSHAYQRMHQAGWSHSKVAMGVLLLNTILSVLAWTAFNQPTWQWSALFVAYAMLTWVYLWVEKKSPFIAKEHHVTTTQA